jgi:hypothetical protein
MGSRFWGALATRAVRMRSIVAVHVPRLATKFAWRSTSDTKSLFESEASPVGGNRSITAVR